MRTFLVVVFALAAVALGGVWLLAQTEAPAADVQMVETAAPAPSPADTSPSAPPEEAAYDTATADAATREPAEAAEGFGEALGEDFGVADDLAVGGGAAAEPSFEAAAAPPPPPVASAPAPAPRSVAAPEPEPLVATQSIADQFESREVTYNRPPSTLALNRPIDVSLVINATDVEGAGREALQGFDGEIVERDVELTDVVAAQLTGPGFEIVSQNVEPRQQLSPRVLNRWQWRVTPTEEGTQVLVLEIFGYAAGALEAEPLDAYRDEIVVEVRNLDRVISFAQEYEPVFAIGAGLFGGLSALFGFLRFRGDRKRRKSG